MPWGHTLDHRQTFLEYTEAKRERMLERLRHTKSINESFLPPDKPHEEISVLDAGCGMGIQALLWARDGYQVTGIDIDADLINRGRLEAVKERLDVQWHVGDIGNCSLPDNSFDVCVASELLEHVPDWRPVFETLCRLTKPGGVCFVSTTNVLCPRQNEFRLPLYSWWPGPLKRRMEQLARTSRPALANYTDYPAVNWFNYLQLKREFRQRGLNAFDRVDVTDLSTKSFPKRAIFRTVRVFPPARFAMHLLWDGTMVVGQKPDDGSSF